METGISAGIASKLDLCEERGVLLARSNPSEARALARAAKGGLLVSPHPGIFARSEYWESLTPLEKNVALAKTLGPLHSGWVFSHQTAALLHGVSVSYRCLEKVHYTTHKKGGGRSSGCLAHHQASLLEWREIGGVRVTTPAMTAIDCARTLALSDALAIMDASLRMGITDEADLKACLRRHKGGAGIGRARQVFELADARAESPAESIARATIIGLGVPIYDLQMVVADLEHPGKSYRLDIVLRRSDGVLVDVEVDGREKYEKLASAQGDDAVSSMMKERQREAAVTAHGILVARISATDAGNQSVMRRRLRAYGLIP